MSMNTLDQRQTLFLVMGNLFHKARNHLDSQFKEFDLSRNEWLIIALLRTHPEGLSQSYTKTYLGIEISYLTKVLNKLENKGLILREVDSENRRNRIIKKNKQAKSDLVKMFKIIEKLNRQILKKITDDELNKIHKLFFNDE